MSFILFIFFVVFVNSFEFDYNEQGLDWSIDFPECGGNEQSPINIDTELINCDYSLELTKESLNINDNSNRIFEIINNEQTIDIHEVSNNKYNVVSQLTDIHGQRYIFGGMHFHWGSVNRQGSEHTFDGISAPLEVHLVHYYDKANSIEEAAAHYESNNNLTTLAVVGILFEIGKKHPEIDNILDNIDGNINRFKLDSFIPETKEYILYDGSLTTPPCFETVKWHLMTNKITLSMKQLNRFRILFDSESNFLSNNFRSIQPIGQRFIMYCDNNIKPKTKRETLLINLLDTIKGNNGLYEQLIYAGVFVILLALFSLCLCFIIKYKITKRTKYRNVPSWTKTDVSS